jgi:glycosidase
VWSDTDQKFLDTRIIFLETEKSNWSWDPVAQAYYWHRFYSHQPDLNFDNPHVFRAITNVMRYWLDLGVDGMRLDAVPYLIEREGTINENLPETHEVLKRLRCEMDRRYGDRMLLAEANQWPEDAALFRRRRRMPYGIPLPADAAHLHGARHRGTAIRSPISCGRRRQSRRAVSGRCSCATATS